MPSVFDVARYILDKVTPITSWKLQKLVFYSQAWATVWDDQEIFPEQFEAWGNGPVCCELYHKHKGCFHLLPEQIDGVPDCLSQDHKDTIDEVINVYGDKSGMWLTNQTQSERPWLDARGDTASGEPSTEVITLDSMAAYYGSF